VEKANGRIRVRVEAYASQSTKKPA
jgi:hypothetical protein